MSFRTALAVFVVAASFGFATADDDNTTGNTSTPTSAPTVTSHPTSAPTSAGTTFIKAPIPAGATCLSVWDTDGFRAGDTLEIGGVDTSTLASVFTSADCSGTPKARRLQTGGSFKIDPPTSQAFAAGTKVVKTTPNYGPTCFPGDATVNVYGRGATPVASLSVGDRVLVGSGAFEPVLSFLHKVPNTPDIQHESLTVVHSQGTFRASENHLVFVVSEGGVRGDKPVSALRPGDQLLADGMPSLIVAIGLEITTVGMYAPLTSSGALVVDGVVASNYGTPSSGLSLPHGAAHAAFFALRVFHNLGLGELSRVGADATMHPFVAMMFQQLRLDKLLVTVA